jgi:hypothetical protein
MDETPKDTSSRKLLERIARLESDNAHLKARCDDLLSAFKSHVDGNVSDFSGLYDLIYPLVDKVFPEFLPTLRQIKAIVPGGYADPTVDTRPQEYKRD